MFLFLLGLRDKRKTNLRLPNFSFGYYFYLGLVNTFVTFIILTQFIKPWKELMR